MWLNGDKVLAEDVYRWASPDQDTTEVTLQQGWNMLLIKVCEGPHEWHLYCRLVAADGKPLEDVQYALEPK